MKLINKDAVMAEIERILDNSEEVHNNQYILLCNHFKWFLDTLEVKEVDLEKHLKEDIEDVFFDLDGVAVKGATHYLTVEDVKDLAKHFFELGLYSHLSWQDVKRLSETGETFMNSEESDNLSEEEYYTEILNKFKAQKGEKV